MSMRHTKVISGASNPRLAEKICERLGISLSTTKRQQFSNGELSVSLSESVRGQDVYIIQSGSGQTLANDALMELVILISASKMSSAKRITAVIPFFFYSKQCKKKGRGTIPAKLVANMLQVAGVDHIMTMDLHSSQLQGFFNVPVDSLFAEPTIAMYIQNNVTDYHLGVVVAKNPGATKRVTSLADKLSIDFALVQKVQHVRENDVTENVWTVVGEVRDKIAFILDDMIDSTKTFLKAAKALLDNGATKVYIVVTHNLLPKEGYEALEAADCIHAVFTTNTVPAIANAECKKLKIIDITPTLAEGLRRSHNGESISYLFNNVPQ